MALVESFVQVWAAAKATLALIVSPAAPEFTLIPPVPMVRVKPPVPAMLTLFVLVGLTPRTVRLLIEKFWPSSVLRFVPSVVAKMTSEVESGTDVLVVPACSTYQLVEPPLFVFQVFPPGLWSP